MAGGGLTVHVLHLRSRRGCNQLGDDSITVVGQHCSQLQALDVTCVEGSAPSRVSRAWSGLERRAGRCVAGCGLTVHVLHLRSRRDCFNLTDASIAVVGQHCTQLQTLNVG